MKASDMMTQDDTMRLHAYAADEGHCAICAQTGERCEVHFGFGWRDGGKTLLCHSCMAAVLGGAHHPVMKKFLPIFLKGFAKSVEFSTDYDRAHSLLATNHAKWDAALKQVCQAIINGGSVDVHRLAVANFVDALTGLGILDACSLVWKAFDEEEKNPMNRARQLARQLVKDAGDGARAKKIDFIKQVRAATNLGLKEAKEIVEEAMVSGIPTPAPNGKVPDQYARKIFIGTYHLMST